MGDGFIDATSPNDGRFTSETSEKTPDYTEFLLEKRSSFWGLPMQIRRTFRRRDRRRKRRERRYQDFLSGIVGTKEDEDGRCNEDR